MSLSDAGLLVCDFLRTGDFSLSISLISRHRSVLSQNFSTDENSTASDQGWLIFDQALFCKALLLCSPGIVCTNNGREDYGELLMHCQRWTKMVLRFRMAGSAERSLTESWRGASWCLAHSYSTWLCLKAQDVAPMNSKRRCLSERGKCAGSA